MSNLKLSTLSNLAGTQSTAIENAINGSAKAWVNFNGTGTVAIRASYNVSSITDNGTGNYTVNFTNAISDANYSVVGNSGTTQSDHRVLIPNFNAAPTASACRIQTSALNSSSTDDLYINVTVFR